MYGLMMSVPLTPNLISLTEHGAQDLKCRKSALSSLQWLVPSKYSYMYGSLPGLFKTFSKLCRN